MAGIKIHLPITVSQSVQISSVVYYISAPASGITAIPVQRGLGGCIDYETQT